MLSALLHGNGRVDATLLSDQGRHLYAAASNAAPVDPQKAEALVSMRIGMLKKEAMKQEGARLEASIREAERLNDPVKLRELLTQRINLKMEMDRVGAT